MAKIDSEELIKLLPAMIQGTRRFAPTNGSGNYHYGKVKSWYLRMDEVAQGIREFCEYKETGEYKPSAPINGNWNVLEYEWESEKG